MLPNAQLFLLIFLVLGMVTLQPLVSHYFPETAILIDLPLLALLYITFTQQSLFLILFLSSLVGLLQDSQTVDLLGLNGFRNLIVCTLAYLSGTMIVVDHILTRLIIVWISFVLSDFISWLLRIFFLNRYEVLNFYQILLGASLSTVIGILLFIALDKILAIKDM